MTPPVKLIPWRAVLQVLVLGFGVLVPSLVSAQTFAIESSVERLTILDDSAREPHTGFGVAARRRFGPRVDLGVGVSMLTRSAGYRLFGLKAQLSVDLVASPADRTAVPFVVLSVGVVNDVGPVRSNLASTAELSAGVRVRVSNRWFLAPWVGAGVTAYPHRRLGISVGRGF